MDRLAPESSLRLEWVYGYRGHQCHNNLFFAPSNPHSSGSASVVDSVGADCNKVVYFVAGVCIVYDILQHKQTFFMGHSDDVLCLCQHPEGQLFASGQIGKEPFVAVWDSSSCETKSLLLNGHQRGISAVHFSHDGNLLVSIGLDDHNSMCIWDWRKGRIIAQHRTHGDKVLDVKFVPGNNSKLVTCGVKHIKFWTLSGNSLSGKGGILGSVAPLQTFLTLTFDRYGNVLAGALNGSVYQFEENKLIKAHPMHKGAVFCLSACEVGYVSGGKDGMVKLLDLNFNPIQQYNLVETEQGYPGLCVKSVYWKDDKVLVGTQNSEIFELSSRSTEKVRLLVQGHSEGELWALATHPVKANTFATSSDDCTIQQWSITERGVIAKKQLENKARSLAYSPDAVFLAVGFTNGFFSVFRSRDFSEVHSAQIRSEVIHELKFSPDGAHLAVGSNDNYVDIFSCLQNWKKVGQCSGNSSFITHIDWSQDGKFLQTNSGAAERLVYKMPSGKRLTSKDEIDKIVWQTWTGVLGQEVAGIWEKYTDTNDVNAIDVNFEQGVCVTGDDFGLVKLFKFPTFKKGAKFKKYTGHSAHVTNVRFTCDRKRVITVGGADHAVFQWRFLIGSEEDESDVAKVVSANGVSDSEASDSELSNAGEVDSEIEREAEQNYDRFVSKEYAADLYKKERGLENGLASGKSVSEMGDKAGKQKHAPSTGLALEFVFGYRGYDCRNNVFLLSSGEVVYHVAALGVVYNRKSHSQRFYNGHTDDILSLAMHPNKDIVATGQVGKWASVHVWDCATLKCVSLLRGDMAKGVCALDFSSEDAGKKLAAVSLDDHHTVHVWDWKRGERLATVRGHKDKVLSVKFNPFNSEKLLIVGIKHVKFLTQVGGGFTTKRGTFGTVAKLVTMCCATYGNSESLCFTGAESGLVYVWNDNVLARTVEAHVGGPCFAVSAVTNYEGFVTGGKDGRVCLWNESFDKNLRSYEVFCSEALKITGVKASLRAVRIGHGVIVAGTKNGEIVEIDKGGNVSILVQGHQEGEIWGVAVQKGGDLIATVSDDKTLKLWDLKSYRMVANFNLKKSARCVDFSPNGQYIAVGFVDGSFAVFGNPIGEEGSSELVAVVEVHHRKEEISDVKFSPESAKYIAVGSHDNFVDIYNINSEKRVGVCKGASSYITHLDWDIREKLIMVTSGAKELLFFEAPRGKRVSLRNDVIESTVWATWTSVIGQCVEGIWPPRCDVTDINACCRVNDLIATGDDFGFVKLFNFPAKGKFAKFKQYSGHSAHVTNVRWTSDGSKLVSLGGADTAVMVWRNKNSIPTVPSETPRGQSELSKVPSVDSGASEVSFGDSEPEGYDSDVQKEISIDFDSKIYPSSREVLRKSEKNEKERFGKSSNAIVSRAVPKVRNVVASNSQKPPKSEIVGLELQHVIGYRGFDTRNNLHFVNDSKDILYHAAAVCIVQNLSTGEQKFYVEHSDDVLCVTVCQFPKLKHVAASGQVGLKPAVHIWDHSTLDTIAILNDGHSRGVCHLDFSSSGRYLCTVGLDSDHTLVVWKWQEALRVCSVATGPNRVFAAQFRPDSDSLLVSVGVKHVSFWSVAGDTLLPKKAHIPAALGHKKQTMLSIAFGTDNLTFTGAMSGDIYVWKHHVLSRVVSKAHKGPVFSLFTTLKDGLILSAGKDRNVKESPSAVKLWDSEMKRCKAFYLDCCARQVIIKATCRANGLILLGSKDSQVVMIEEKRTSCSKVVDAHAEGELNGLATHPLDANLFVSSSDDSTVRIWDMNNLKLKECAKTLSLGGLASRCVAYSADGELLAVGLNNGSFRVLVCSTLQTWSQKRDRATPIQTICFSPDGSKLAVGSEGGCVDVYNVGGGPSLPRDLSLKGVKDAVLMMDFSADNKFIQVVSGDYRRQVFDLGTAVEVMDPDIVDSITWAAWTSIIGDEVEGIWPRLSDGSSSKSTQGDLINSAHVNPRGVNRIATGDDSGYVKLFPFPSSESSAKQSEDDQLLQYPGHSAHVTSVRFTMNDSHLVSSGGEDSCLFVWKCASV